LARSDALAGVPLNDGRWQRLIQKKLGSSVQVRSLKRIAGTSGETALEVSVTHTTPENIKQAVAAARADESVARAEPVVLWKAHAAVNDPLAPNQWHLQRISASAAWDTTFGSSSVIVAVIDTGVDTAHADLAANIWTNTDEIPGNGVDDDHNGYVDDVHGWDFVSVDASLVVPDEDPGPPDADPTDKYGHGTSMAGVIAAQANNGAGVAGVAPGVTIMPLRAGYMDAESPEDATFQSPDVASAIRYAVDNGARIISMSFGGYEPSPLVGDAVQYADSRGVLLVASAGNDSTDQPCFPAAYGNVLATAALEADDTWANFSNYGTWVDVAAPGEDILSLLPENGYWAMSGTSPAAAIVSGVAALAASSHSNWTKQQLRAQVLATVDEVASYPSLTDVTRPPLLGAGRVNAQNAVGETPYSSHAYPLLVQVTENPGNGNQELNAGEAALVSASWKVTAARSGLSARLASTDPWLHVSAATQSISVGDDQVALARLPIIVDPHVPADYTASLAVQLVDQSGVVDSASIKVLIEPTWRELKQMIPDKDHVTVPMQDGSDMFLAATYGAGTQVYASIRRPTGAFTRAVVVSEPEHSAAAPVGVTDSNGDVHVAFVQLVSSDDGNIGFAAHRRYQLATGTWTPLEFLDTSTAIRSGMHTTIGLDRAGQVHVAWPLQSSEGAIATVHQLADGTWSPVQRLEIALADYYPGAQLQLLEVNGELWLFASNPSDSAAEPLKVFRYDGANWTGPTATAGVYAGILNRPFSSNGAVYRIYSPAAGQAIDLARFDANTFQWVFWKEIVGPTGLTLGELSASMPLGNDSFATHLTYLTPNSAGHLGEMVFTGASSIRTVALPTTTDWVEKYPSVVADSSGNVHTFTQGYSRNPNQYWPLVSTYTTNAKLTGAAYPSTPVVVDDGSITSTSTQLHASWTSVYSEGIANYRVAWGTAPGLDDVLPWQDTAATEMTFDLQTRHLLAEQPVYATVVAQSGFLPDSRMGSSDGIYYVPPCTAATWSSIVVYQDPGMEVTYNDAMYRSLYWNSATTPGDAWGPWQRVTACLGAPTLPACTATPWSTGQSYQAGVLVSYQGAEFQGSWASRGIDPTGANGNPWKWLRGCTR
jgi:subtilisin family serine protease